MGYSVYAIAKNKKLRDKMFKFLEENFVNLAKHFEAGIDQTGIRLAKGSSGPMGISYANDENAVGFDYSSWTFVFQKMG